MSGIVSRSAARSAPARRDGVVWAREPVPSRWRFTASLTSAATKFTATDSFEAVFGSSVGLVFGGGGGVVLPQNIFIDARAIRFKKDGQRVVRQRRRRFDLGIANTVTITPFEITGGYRFGRSRDSRPARMPAAESAGIATKRRTSSRRATTSLSDTFTGFHLLGGAEFRVTSGSAIAGEAAWARCRTRSASNQAASARRSTRRISAARRSASRW